MLKSRVFTCVLGLVGMFLAGDVMAMREGGFGNAPVKDQNWRVGAVDVANLKSRLAYWHGPTSETQFLYRGNTEAFAEAIRLFSLIRAPELELYVHDGPHEEWSLKPSSNETDPEARKRDPRVDWTFLIHDAQEWYRWNNDPEALIDRSPNYRKPLAAPRMDVYIGGGAIEWDKIRVPANVRVVDERVSALGIKLEGGSIVRGTVYDQATSKTLTGAAIVVQTEKDGKRVTLATAQADAEGKFQIEKIPAGTYQVNVSADKYAARYMGYAVLNGRDVKSFVVDLAPEQTAAGMVLDGAGRPVAGAEVRVQHAMGMDGMSYGALSPKVTTDAQGRFTIAGLPRGYCSLRFTAKGLHAVWDPKSFSTSAKDIVLRAGSAGAVKGRVVGADGAPRPNSQINIQDAAGAKVGTWGGSMNVKEDGTFSFENVPVGKYVIAPKPIFLPGMPLPAEAKTITVEAGKTVEVEFEVK